VVIVVVIVFIVVALTGSTPTVKNADARPLAPASLVSALAGIPASVYNSVGTGSADTPPFVKTTGQPLLKSGGLPQLVYMGGEFCPYCAIDRWALIGALSRFGTFSGLKLMSSSPGDVYANTPTFTFYQSSYKSPYFVFTPLEVENVNKDSLVPIPTSLNPVIAKYGGATYFPLNTTGIGFPFLDFGNKYLQSGDPDWLNPDLIQPLTRAEIAAALAEASNPAAQAIDAEANFVSAAVCSMDGNAPASVCTSAGVTAAAKVLAAVKATK
jgi:thiol-disulfide isomerase/thioredoxin